MASARSPVLLRNRISLLQPARVLPPRWHAKFLASGMALAPAQLQRASAVMDFPRTRGLLLKRVSEFSPALASLLPFWLSPLFLVQATLLSYAIFSLQFSVLALGSRIFSLFGKRQATRVSRWALASGLPLLLPTILSAASIYEDVEIPLPLAMPWYRAVIFL